MRFTQISGISPGSGDDWFDPVLTEDTPLYVDPFLVFEDQSPLFADAHETVVRFFATCRDLVRLDNGRRGRNWDKALRLLTFPEPKEFALGLAMGSPNGSGTDEHYAEQMANALDAISRAVERRVAYVEMFALFVPGLGVDRISDIFCNILKSQFIKYTQQVCERHGVSTDMISVRHASWNATTGRWSDARLRLPRSPVTGGAVLLTPDRFLQDIPQRITASGFYRWAETNRNASLRDDLNYDLGKELSQSERAQRGRDLATRRPDIAFDYVDEVAGQADPSPYDVEEDPDLPVASAVERRADQAAQREDRPGGRRPNVVLAVRDGRRRHQPRAEHGSRSRGLQVLRRLETARADRGQTDVEPEAPAGRRGTAAGVHEQRTDLRRVLRMRRLYRRRGLRGPQEAGPPDLRSLRSPVRVHRDAALR